MKKPRWLRATAWIAAALAVGTLLAAGCGANRTQPRNQARLSPVRPRPGEANAGKLGRVVYAFYTEPEEGVAPGSYEDMIRHASEIDIVAPFWFRVAERGDGSIEPFGNTTEAQRRRVVADAHSRRIRVEALIHNMLYAGGPDASARVAAALLGSPAARRRFAAEAAALVSREGYDGVHIDFEMMRPEQRSDFVALLTALRNALPRGKGLSVSVFPPSSTQSQWTGVYDYAAIGRLADHIAVMTYDEHGQGGPPGAIASAAYVEKNVAAAVQAMPKQKILLGLGGFGFDWPPGGGMGRYIPFATAMDIAHRNGATVSHDPPGTAHFAYGGGHQVWFEDASSWRPKLDLVTRYNLGGVGIWRLGMEDEAGWAALREAFRTR